MSFSLKVGRKYLLRNGSMMICVLKLSPTKSAKFKGLADNFACIINNEVFEKYPSTGKYMRNDVDHPLDVVSYG